MGKNADKRRARKRQDDDGVEVVDVVDAPPTESVRGTTTTTTTTTPAWWARQMLPPPLEVGDASLARALFRITTLVGNALARPHEDGLAGMALVAEAVADVVEADTVSLLRLEAGDGDIVPARLVLTASHGLDIVDVGVVSFKLGDGLAGRVALTGEAVRVDDAPRDPRFVRLHGQRTEIGSLLAVPLVMGRKLLGVLTVSRREIKAFSPADEDRLHLVATTIAQDLEQARLYREAVADPLTGLVSRVAFLHALPREVEIARRYQTQLSLLLIDVDNLRALNTAGGRSAGDRFLRTMSARLAQTVRAADLVARFGGDEIAVLLPMTPANQARATAKRLVRLVAAPVADGTPAPTLTVAVATLQGMQDEDTEGLLGRVDRALLEGKARGGNTIVTASVDGASGV